MTITPVELPLIGTFEPQFLSSGELLCFGCKVNFRSSTPELIVNPDSNGNVSPVAAEHLSSRYRAFINAAETALASLPTLLREECKNYEIPTDQIADTDIISQLEWQNIKLDPSGTIECYVSNEQITNNFDIVIGFDENHRLYELHFDG